MNRPIGAVQGHVLPFLQHAEDSRMQVCCGASMELSRALLTAVVFGVQGVSDRLLQARVFVNLHSLSQLPPFCSWWQEVFGQHGAQSAPITPSTCREIVEAGSGRNSPGSLAAALPDWPDAKYTKASLLLVHRLCRKFFCFRLRAPLSALCRSHRRTEQKPSELGASSG